MVEPRDVDWDLAMKAGRDRRRPSASRSRPPTRSTCSTPPAPPASPRASSATTAATPSRWPGRCRTSTTCTPGQVWWTASDVGWVVGHSYIVYAPLITGATTVLYEGKPVGTPDAGAFWRVIAEHGVEALFTAPTAIRAIKKEDPSGELLADHDLAAFRTLFLAGERLDPETYHWATERARRAGGRPLVADRDRLGDRGEPARPGRRCRSSRARRPCRCPGYARGGARRAGQARSPAGHRGRDLPAAAAAAGHADDAVGRRRAVRRVVPVGLRRLLPLRRRRLRRRGRLPVRDGPHRRRDQRRRAPAVDRLDGGGARARTRRSPSAR